MGIRVHWILDGRMEVDAASLEEAEKLVDSALRDALVAMPDFMEKFGVVSIQGKAYLHNDEVENDETENT